jgi:hypothetical protein
LGKLEILESCFLKKKKRGVEKRRYHPSEAIMGISNRSFSRRCQKFMTDFGMEESFQLATKRMQEHHGVEINASAVRRVTLIHATRAEELVTEIDPTTCPSKQMILEMDGEMVPLVEYTQDAKDKRTAKKNFGRS